MRYKTERCEVWAKHSQIKDILEFISIGGNASPLLNINISSGRLLIVLPRLFNSILTVVELDRYLCPKLEILILKGTPVKVTNELARSYGYVSLKFHIKSSRK